MHVSIPPVTVLPGQPQDATPGQVRLFGPGGEERFEAVLSRGYRAIENGK